MKLRVTKVPKEVKPFLQLTENMNRRNRKRLSITRNRWGWGQFGTGQIFTWPDAVGGLTISICESGWCGANFVQSITATVRLIAIRRWSSFAVLAFLNLNGYPVEPPRPEGRRFLDYAQRYSAHVSI